MYSIAIGFGLAIGTGSIAICNDTITYIKSVLRKKFEIKDLEYDLRILRLKHEIDLTSQ